MHGPCMAINGSFFLHAGANVSFEGCRNGLETEEGAHGGGLAVQGDAELHGGRLGFRNCWAGLGDGKPGHGGAVYVGGKGWRRVWRREWFRSMESS